MNFPQDGTVGSSGMGATKWLQQLYPGVGAATVLRCENRNYIHTNFSSVESKEKFFRFIKNEDIS